MIQAKFEKKGFISQAMTFIQDLSFLQLTVNMAGWQKKTKKICECFIFSYSKYRKTAELIVEKKLNKERERDR